VKLSANPYLNTPPTELNRKIKTEKDESKRRQMQTALNAWRTVVPGPFRKTGAEDMKEASDILKLAKAVLGSSKVPMTEEEEDWYDVLESYLERLVIDGEKMTKIIIQKWNTGIMLEAAYGYADDIWIIIETSDDRMMVDFTLDGDADNPTAKVRLRGTHFDKPQVAKRLIDKVTRGHR